MAVSTKSAPTVRGCLKAWLPRPAISAPSGLALRPRTGKGDKIGPGVSETYDLERGGVAKPSD